MRTLGGPFAWGAFSLRTCAPAHVQFRVRAAPALRAERLVTEARVEVPEPQLRIYDRLAVKPGHPVCVPVKSGKCGGCHLKVPTHIEVMAKSGAEIATCDQCGRILYWQP